MDLIIVEDTTVATVESNTVDDCKIGQKARGLLGIPSPWRLPFLCVSSNVFNRYRSVATNEEKKYIIVATAENIRASLPKISIQESDYVIVRSSGVEEGLSDRGRYDSKICSVSNLEQVLSDLFSGLVHEFADPPEMALVVQKFIPHQAQGHLSNERRFSKVKRDWVFEYKTEDGEIVSDKIGVRFWRTALQGVEHRTLFCHSISMIQKALYPVAWYYTKKKTAIHFEFIWDGTSIIIVQADPEKNNSDVVSDPTAYDIKVQPVNPSGFRVLRKAGKDDRRYTKVKNSLLYQTAGLCTVPLYILDDQYFINCIARREIPPSLEDDLRELTKNSIVVRVDIADADLTQKQLLPRSNEIRNYDALKAWLYEKGALLSQGTDIALLFHVFIPAIAAAFVDASPTGRIVEIEALWGLPEGLYYNAHDKITVDTKSISAEITSVENVEILSKRPMFKEYYIAPNEHGQWVSKKTSQPYDWALCIDDASIKQIAVESRKIAGIANQNVSVMWFIGIDQEYYGTANLAWYHEAYSKSGYTTSEYKKKYFYEAETVIRNLDDYNEFVNNQDIKVIKISPVDDALLRNKDFLKNVGETARSRGASIILDGTILAHPLYQLCRTGARVLTPNLQTWYKEESNYNKLVRDKIPEIILSNGEETTCYILDEDALLRALLEKSVEEAIEIATASSNEDFLEELGDEYEVLSSILQVTQLNKRVDPLQKKIIGRSLYNYGNTRTEIRARFDLLNKSYYRSFQTDSLGECEIELSYEGPRLQLEMHFYRNRKQTKRSLFCQKLTSDPEIIRILRRTLSLSSFSSLQDIKQTARSVQAEILQLVCIHGKCCESFMQSVHEKRIKRGGFERGYMLTSSSLSSYRDEDSPQIQLDSTNNEYRRISLLDYPTAKNADFLAKGTGELVLRVSLPLCFNTYHTVFDNNTVKKYVGDKRIAVTLSRKRSIVNLLLESRRDDTIYTQLELKV